MITQLGSLANPYSECIAISTSPDLDLCPQAPVSLHISREPTLPTTASGGWGARLWIRQETSRLDIPFPAARVIQLFIHRCDIGRTPTDPLGTMASEASLWEGAGSQTGYSRWGDYTSMQIDPSDDCTFWYVNEYLPTTHPYGWFTRLRPPA